MRTVLVSMILLFMAVGCVEIYEFKVNNDKPSLVIEGQISNMSYKEFRDLPSDGRFFTVKLRFSSNVTNIRDKMVKNAGIILSDDKGNNWAYTSSEGEPGIYYLFDPEFQAETDNRYKLRVTLPEGDVFESDWERMPDVSPDPMGKIDFEELDLLKYIYRAGERTLVTLRGINVRISLPVVTTKEPVYYKWNFLPTWIYRAPLLRPTSANYKCWITDPYYLSDYVTHRDFIGGYKQDLFLFPIEGNDRFYDRLSVLVSQFSMSEKYFNYWTEIQQQDLRKGLFDPPPFNLQSNLHAVNSDRDVFGYFGVVEEQGTRWNVDRLSFSYPVENTWKKDCENRIISIFDKCINCFNASDFATNVEPDWWEK